MKDLINYAGEDRIISSHDLAKELENTPTVTTKTGIPSLDRILNGVEGGELIVVTGPTGEGKTSLLMSITSNLADKEINSAWFTLEVTPKQFLQKIMRASNKLPLFYLPNKNIENNIKWIEERICESIAKFNTKVIFIDHIHQIFSLAQVRTNISLEIGDLVGIIKDIAVRENITIFLVAHSKDNTLSPTSEPKKQDIRDSGMISRLADSIIAVWRVNSNWKDAVMPRLPKELSESDNWAKVRVLKNRREGVLGTLYMQHGNHYLKELEYNGGIVEDKKEIDTTNIWG